MPNQTAADKVLSPDQRDQLEADFTFKRVVELELAPVRGNFDAAHLKEINRRIFQDLPVAGFDDGNPVWRASLRHKKQRCGRLSAMFKHA